LPIDYTLPVTISWEFWVPHFLKFQRILCWSTLRYTAFHFFYELFGRGGHEDTGEYSHWRKYVLRSKAVLQNQDQFIVKENSVAPNYFGNCLSNIANKTHKHKRQQKTKSNLRLTLLVVVVYSKFTATTSKQKRVKGRLRLRSGASCGDY
jgi:hypothetical protein